MKKFLFVFGFLIVGAMAMPTSTEAQKIRIDIDENPTSNNRFFFQVETDTYDIGGCLNQAGNCSATATVEAKSIA